MKRQIPDRVKRRVMSRTIVQQDGCWVTTYARGGSGYAHAAWRQDGVKHHVGVHRVAYEASVGPIPDGMTIDHLCRNTLCVRPSHLRLLTPSENSAEPRLRRTHCPHGHPYDANNTYVDPTRGWRKCRACRVLENRRRRGRAKNIKTLIVACAALLASSACTLHPSSPGFLPDGSSVWIFDVDRDDTGDGHPDRTVRMWAYWCHGTVDTPQPCGTERNWQWGDLGTVRP